jgi:hypothetical protein
VNCALDARAASADPNAFPDRHAALSLQPCHAKTRLDINAIYLL